jgi:hypothetical protein
MNNIYIYSLRVVAKTHHHHHGTSCFVWVLVYACVLTHVHTHCDRCRDIVKCHEGKDEWLSLILVCSCVNFVELIQLRTSHFKLLSTFTTFSAVLSNFISCHTKIFYHTSWIYLFLNCRLILKPHLKNRIKMYFMIA